MPRILADEIIKELERERNRVVKLRKDLVDGAPSYSRADGRIDSLVYAILLIENWNEPNHGRMGV